jgi:hypothetical protein
MSSFLWNTQTVHEDNTLAMDNLGYKITFILFIYILLIFFQFLQFFLKQAILFYLRNRFFVFSIWLTLSFYCENKSICRLLSLVLEIEPKAYICQGKYSAVDQHPCWYFLFFKLQNSYWSLKKDMDGSCLVMKDSKQAQDVSKLHSLTYLCISSRMLSHTSWNTKNI